MTNDITNTTSTKRKNIFNWRLFWLLFAMATFGMLALTPYSLAMTGQKVNEVDPITLSMQFITQLIPLILFIGLGLLMGRQYHLGAPILDKWTKGISNRSTKKAFPKAILLGILVSLLIIVLDFLVFSPIIQNQISTAELSQANSSQPAAWQGFLASFYGGITEEIMMRLFLMTLIVWLGSKIFRRSEDTTSKGVIWAAIIISTIVFGLGHLPAVAATGLTITPILVIRALVLNAAGIAFGWLYWKYGLEHAMVSHFTADIVLHVISVLIIGAF